MAGEIAIPYVSSDSYPSLGRVARDRPRFQGCSNIRDYEVIDKLGEGTFGEVHKARSKFNGSMVALKKILMHNEKDGFPITALREIKLLKMLSHPNILKLDEMAIERAKGDGKKKAIMYMVTPYMDHDLSGLLENPHVHFTEPQIKCYMLQLLEGLRYLHENQILHRDMKAANLLISNKGILQIADFGLARHYDEPVPRRGQGNGEAKRDYTTLVVTRWYRPPELLLQLRKYTPAIDMWGVGCVFAEMFVGKPILAGNSDLNQAQLIFDLVGSPTEETMPGWSALPGCEGIRQFKPRASTLSQRFREQGSAVISLLSEMLKLDWRKRINAIDALEHPYFGNDPLPAMPADIPQFEDSHELDRRKFRGRKAALPPAPAGGTVGMGHPGKLSDNSNSHSAVGTSWVNGSRMRRTADSYNNEHLTRVNHAGRPQTQLLQHTRTTVGPSNQPGRQTAHSTGTHQDLRLPPRPSTTAWGLESASGYNRPRLDTRGAGSAMVDTYIPDYSRGGDGDEFSKHRLDVRRREERIERHRGNRRDEENPGQYQQRSRSPGVQHDRVRERVTERTRDVYRR